MKTIKLKSLDLKKFYLAIKSLKASGLSISIEFFSGETFCIKMVDHYSNCLKVLELNMVDYFSKNESGVFPEYLSVVLKYDELVSKLKLYDMFSKCHLSLEFELTNDINQCKKLTINLADSLNSSVDFELDCQDNTQFTEEIKNHGGDFQSSQDFLFSFTLTPKIQNMVKVCDDNKLKICLTKEELGYNVYLTDDDFILVINVSIEIINSGEALIALDSKYLKYLGSESYIVSVSEYYVFFKGITSGELTILKTL